jgi:hypothetical protein
MGSFILSPISRRRLLTALGSGSAAALLAACARPAAPGSQPTAQAIAPAGAAASAGGAIVAAPAVDAPAPASRPTAPDATAVAPTPTQGLLNGVAPDATATPIVPAASPTTAPTATPAAPTASPTATTLVYDAARLKDKLGSAQTSYAGSISERAWNVELAAKRLDGTRVAPGAVFSFNEAVGATTIKAGFRIGYGITIKDDKPETIPSVAGGICQVATTVFQAAFWAGLPFIERHYHLYWIARYGVAPSGRTGMDATVDDPGVDLKFKNTTGDWIRLDSWIDGANVGFTIYGVDPGWEVTAGKPKIFEVVKAEQALVHEDDPTMPAGRELLVEHAEDGFKVTMSRLVKLKDKTVDDMAYTNYYRPSRNVMLVGTKGATPRPTVSTTTTPGTGSPQATGTPGTATPAPSPTKPAATPTPAPLPPGQARVPSLVGVPEAQARKQVDQAGLANTYSNYQGPGQVSPQVLNAVAVGSVISQSPAPGSVVAPGTTVYLAVRKA